MTYNEQTDALMFEMLGLITRYLNEFDLNEATIVGVLENVKRDVVEAWVDFAPDFDLDDDQDPTDGFDDLFDK